LREARDHRGRRRRTALSLVMVAGFAGAVAWVLLGAFGPLALAPSVGFIVAALTYLIPIWVRVGRLGPSDTARHAMREDPTRYGADLALLVASAASLGAVALVLVSASSTSGAGRALRVALAIATVLLAWIVTHTVYMLRYATIFHTAHNKGVDFNQEEPPRYRDFAYLAFTIGMTYQVSDTAFTSSAMRGVALRHALLSYAYGTVIFALTINLLAGLAR
jgi:uncharacterized membrane protein